MSLERRVTQDVALQTQASSCLRLCWRYLASQGLPVFSDRCAMARAASHILLEAQGEARINGQLLALSLACMAAIGAALKAWIILSHGPVVADLTIRLASGVALIITGLDASAAREKWTAARNLIRAIEAGQVEQAVRLALKRSRTVVEDTDLLPPWYPRL